MRTNLSTKSPNIDKGAVWIVDSQDDLQRLERMPTGSSDPRVHLCVMGHPIVFNWGRQDEIGSTSFWIEQASLARIRTHRLGSTLEEEVAACVLGGYGIPAEIGLAAFDHLREAGLLAPGLVPSATELENTLMRPIKLPSGRVVRYRFPRQRARRLFSALTVLAQDGAPSSPTRLREWLLGIDGIGPKTASWIVRNWTASDEVAIIDIHVHRAGLAAGFFVAEWRLPRDYPLFELAFLAVSRIGDVRASVLDACIWQQMRVMRSWWGLYYPA